MPEFMFYILCGLIPCGIIAAICFIVAKKDGAKLEDLLSNVSDDDRAKLRSQPYNKKDGKMYITEGLIADIKEENGKASVFLLFYNAPRNEYYDQKAKLTSDELKSKGLSKGAFVPCLMKFDAQYQIFEFKKLA